MIAQAVYLLCALTSVVCAVLLMKGYLSNRTRLLLWSGVFFGLLAVSNILLFIDLVIIPHGMDLSLLRTAITAFAHILLVFGLASKTS